MYANYQCRIEVKQKTDNKILFLAVCEYLEGRSAMSAAEVDMRYTLFVKSLLKYVFDQNSLSWIPIPVLDKLSCGDPFTDSIGIELLRWMRLMHNTLADLSGSDEAVVEKQRELLDDSCRYTFRANKFYEFLALTVGLSMLCFKSGSKDVAAPTVSYIAKVMSRIQHQDIIRTLENYANRGHYNC